MDGYRLLAERGLEYKIVRAAGAFDAATKARELREAGWVVVVERAR